MVKLLIIGLATLAAVLAAPGLSEFEDGSLSSIEFQSRNKAEVENGGAENVIDNIADDKKLTVLTSRGDRKFIFETVIDGGINEAKRSSNFVKESSVASSNQEAIGKNADKIVGGPNLRTTYRGSIKYRRKGLSINKINGAEDSGLINSFINDTQKNIGERYESGDIKIRPGINNRGHTKFRKSTTDTRDESLKFGNNANVDLGTKFSYFDNNRRNKQTGSDLLLNKGKNLNYHDQTISLSNYREENIHDSGIGKSDTESSSSTFIKLDNNKSTSSRVSPPTKEEESVKISNEKNFASSFDLIGVEQKTIGVDVNPTITPDGNTTTKNTDSNVESFDVNANKADIERGSLVIDKNKSAVESDSSKGLKNTESVNVSGLVTDTKINVPQDKTRSEAVDNLGNQERININSGQGNVGSAGVVGKISNNFSFEDKINTDAHHAPTGFQGFETTTNFNEANMDRLSSSYKGREKLVSKTGGIEVSVNIKNEENIKIRREKTNSTYIDSGWKIRSNATDAKIENRSVVLDINTPNENVGTDVTSEAATTDKYLKLDTKLGVTTASIENIGTESETLSRISNDSYTNRADYTFINGVLNSGTVKVGEVITDTNSTVLLDKVRSKAALNFENKDGISMNYKVGSARGPGHKDGNNTAGHFTQKGSVIYKAEANSDSEKYLNYFQSINKNSATSGSLSSVNNDLYTDKTDYAIDPEIKNSKSLEIGEAVTDITTSVLGDKIKNKAVANIENKDGLNNMNYKLDNVSVTGVIEETSSGVSHKDEINTGSNFTSKGSVVFKSEANSDAGRYLTSFPSMNKNGTGSDSLSSEISSSGSLKVRGAITNTKSSVLQDKDRSVATANFENKEGVNVNAKFDNAGASGVAVDANSDFGHKEKSNNGGHFTSRGSVAFKAEANSDSGIYLNYFQSINRNSTENGSLSNFNNYSYTEKTDNSINSEIQNRGSLKVGEVITDTRSAVLQEKVKSEAVTDFKNKDDADTNYKLDNAGATSVVVKTSSDIGHKNEIHTDGHFAPRGSVVFKSEANSNPKYNKIIYPTKRGPHQDEIWVL